MDAILGTFISAFQSGATNLQGKAMGILFILMTIDFFLSVIKSLAQGGTNYFSLFLQKIFPYGAIIYMISNYAYLISVVMEGFLQVGRIVGGTNLSHSPEEIFGKGVQLFSDAMNKISEDENLSFMNMIKGEAGGALFTAIATFLGYLGIFICFAIIALQMAICYLEFYLGAAFLIIFLPFLVFKPMAFLGEKAIGFVIGFGVKYMVLVAVAGVSLKSIDGLVDQASADPSFMAILTVLGAAMLIAWLCWQAPALAAGIMSGGPSLSGAGATHAGLAAAGAAIGAVAPVASKSADMLGNGLNKGVNAIKNKLGGGKASKTEGGDSGGGETPTPPNNGGSNDSGGGGGNVLNSENAGGNTGGESEKKPNGDSNSNSDSPSFSEGSVLNGSDESGGSSGTDSKSSSKEDSQDTHAAKSTESPETTKKTMGEKIKNAGDKMQNVLNKANTLIPDEEHPQGGIQARIE